MSLDAKAGKTMTTTILLFDETASETNNNFHFGLNVTVRRGFKYLELLKPGDRVVMKNLQGKRLGEGIVHQLIAGRMIDIPTSILSLEHDQKCRELNGLIEVVRNCYNDLAIDENEMTVAIVFKVVK